MRGSRVFLTFLPLALVWTSLAWPQESKEPGALTDKAAISSQDSKAGFGRPEAITGTILMVKPEEGIVVLAVRGPSEPASTNILVDEKRWRDENGNVVLREEGTTASEGPGETDFNFRVGSSTLIKVDGQAATLRELAAWKDRAATVRFVPRRAGNFALGIEVG